MKKIIFILLILLVGCTKMEIEPTPPPVVQKIFSVKESRVTDGQSIYFDLPSDGVYTLTLIDKETGQVIGRERFTGKIGDNIKKIYTNSIQSQYLYLLLEDVTKKEIGKTIIITK
jgi:signal peptidase I